MYAAFQNYEPSKLNTGTFADHDGDTATYVGKRTIPTTKRKRTRALQKAAKKKNRK